MKHLKKHRTLRRTATGRTRLLQQLSSALLHHESIVTTEARAKELRRHIEPLITKARRELTLHLRRQLIRDLLHKDDLAVLLEVAKEAKDRPGGYTRITRLPRQRQDAASMVRIDIVKPSRSS